MKSLGCLVFALLGVAACEGAEDGEPAATGGAGSLAKGGQTANAGGASGGAVSSVKGGATGSNGGAGPGGAATGGTEQGGNDGGGTGPGGSTSGGTGDGGTTNGGSHAGGDEGIAGENYNVAVPINDSSWDVYVHFTVKAIQGGGSAFSCRDTRFTMHFTRQGQTLETVLGRDGYVFSGKLEEGGLEPHYTQQGALGFPTRGDCMLSTVSVTGLELTALADVGAGDTPYDIRGRGKANGQFIQGDVGYNVDLSFELSGSPDVKKPAFVPVTNHHPLDAISLAATEPVTSATTVALGSATGSIPLSVSNPSGSLSLFTSPLVLPFGASFAVEATGNDLIGLPFASNLPPVTTLADPGLFAQDGFEAPPKALLSGDAQVVSAVGSVSAISGARSLFVPQLASATLHLARASGTSKLSFSARSFSPVSGFAQLAPPVQVAVVGGSTRVAPSSGAGTGTIATGDPKWAYAGEPQQVSLPLSESGSDVVVRIQPAFCAGFCPIGQAVLIDDLRVE